MAISKAENLSNFLAVSIISVRREAHHFAFIAVLAVANELANHGVEAAERVRQKNAVEHLDLIAFTPGHHGGNEITGTVITETSSPLPG